VNITRRDKRDTGILEYSTGLGLLIQATQQFGNFWRESLLE
jgi:hypothetical protein